MPLKQVLGVVALVGSRRRYRVGHIVLKKKYRVGYLKPRKV